MTEVTVHRMAAGTFLMQAEGHGNLPSPTAHSLLSELGTFPSHGLLHNMPGAGGWASAIRGRH